METTGPITAGHEPASGEAELLRALRAGEASAAERLVAENIGRMLAVSRRLLGNEADAEESVQEAFLSAFKSLERFEGGSSLGTWLYRIAINAALMRRRSRGRRPEVGIDALLPAYEADGHRSGARRDAGSWASGEGAGSGHLESGEVRERVRRAIDRLPEDARTVLMLRDIEGLDTAATAHAIGISESAVKTRLHRARQALRTLLEQELGHG